MKRGVMKGDGFLFEWLISDKAEARPVDVSLVDSSGNPAVTWHVAQAIPVKFSGPGLNASQNEVAIETLEMRALGITVDAG
jgi:phage tail-like protein